MALNLIKLSVGTESIEDLIAWRKERARLLRAAGRVVENVHVTRMVPKRIDELLDGGSIYWVIKGQVQARQKLIGIDPFTDGGGIRRCKIVMEEEVIPTQWQPKRAFQGWRYLKPEDAPKDLGSEEAAVPPKLHADLAELGLL